MKKIISILLAAAMVLCCAMSLAGCGGNNKESEQPSSGSQDTSSAPSSGDNVIPDELTQEQWDDIAEQYKADIKYDTEHEIGYQLENPEKGDEIAIIHTDKGDITLRLFPENAPNTVENFVELAKRGDYDNVPFHRVINNFMIQTGDTTNGDGTGGESYLGGEFSDEFCDKLFNIRGAVSMANSGVDTNGSQFFINQTPPEALASWDMLEASWENMYEGIRTYYGTDNFLGFVVMYGARCFNPNLMTDEEKKLYEENGGNPNLDGRFNIFDRGHTVFGQVISGMDVVDAIAAVEVDSDNNRPVEDINIKTIEITTY